MMREQTCCFTGHRELPTEDLEAIRQKTAAAIREVIAQGVQCFYVGGAVGFDTLAAEVLFSLRRQEAPWIKVILIYPYDGFTSRWDAAQKATYARLLPAYDKAICVAQKASRWVYLARDRRLVDESTCCICYLTKSSGGTAYTVSYAKKKGLPVINIA